MAAGVIWLVGRLRAALGPDAGDAELVRAYARHADAEAFAALVRRHGPMVWATCRRTVGDHHAAEDAFQATFLVLARKAGGLRPAGSLGGWLHAVAVHVSVRARTAADRRKRREMPPTEVAVPEPPEPPDDRALAALDEEVERLPAKLRDAVVLCELEGLSRKGAAARLGVPEGTLSSRLAAARQRLADRLRARGVTPELLAVPAAAVPAGLAEAACGLGAGGVPAPAVAALAGGTMKAMLLKALGVGLVACGLLAAGGRASDEPPAKPAGPPKAEAKPPREGVILTCSFHPDQTVGLVKPDGTVLPAPTLGAADSPWQARLSPDGKRVAVLNTKPDFARDAVITPEALEAARKKNPWGRSNLHLFDLDAPGGSAGPVLDDLPVLWGAWGPGGRQFYGSEIDPAKANVPAADGTRFPFVSWVYDVGRKVKTPLAVPPEHGIVDVSADGRLLLTRRAVYGPQSPPDGTFVVPTDTFGLRPVGGGDFWGVRLSPDGGRVLGAVYTPASEGRPPRFAPAVARLADGVVTRLPLPGENDVAHHSVGCWSPDGRRLALLWMEAVDPANLPVDSPPLAAPVGPGPHFVYMPRVSVSDDNGGNARVIVRGSPIRAINFIDWR